MTKTGKDTVHSTLEQVFSQYREDRPLNSEKFRGNSNDSTYILGPLLVLERMMDQLGITEVLRKLSGDHKKLQFDFQKVVFSQVCSRFIGIPLCFEVHPGNTFEGNTLHDIVEKMQKKFSIRRFIFIADRGLFSFDFYFWE